MGKTIFIIILIAMLLLMGYTVAQRLPYFRRRRVGTVGEQKTNYILERFTRNKKCILMTNVFLPLYKDTCEIDHILIGGFGVAVIETKNLSGEITGSGQQLTHKIGNKVNKFYNPQLQNETHVKNVRYHLRKSEFKDVPIYSIVVFTSDNIKFPQEIGIHLSQLERVIKSLPDKNYNPKGIYTLLKKVRVMSPVAQLRHSVKVNKKNL